MRDEALFNRSAIVLPATPFAGNNMCRSVYLALICSASIQGCTSFNFDYVAPQGNDVATLVVKSTWDGKNQRVIFHGSNPCDPAEARLVGLINAGAIGQQSVNQLDMVVPAGAEIRLSLPQIDLAALRADSATFRYCQPVAAFTPLAGQRYTLEFGACRADLYVTPPGTPGGAQQLPNPLDRSCVVTAQNRGTDAKLFYLAEKPQPK